MVWNGFQVATESEGDEDIDNNLMVEVDSDESVFEDTEDDDDDDSDSDAVPEPVPPADADDEVQQNLDLYCDPPDPSDPSDKGKGRIDPGTGAPGAYNPAYGPGPNDPGYVPSYHPPPLQPPGADYGAAAPYPPPNPDYGAQAPYQQPHDPGYVPSYHPPPLQPPGADYGAAAPYPPPNPDYGAQAPYQQPPDPGYIPSYHPPPLQPPGAGYGIPGPSNPGAGAAGPSDPNPARSKAYVYGYRRGYAQGKARRGRSKKKPEIDAFVNPKDVKEFMRGMKHGYDDGYDRRDRQYRRRDLNRRQVCRKPPALLPSSSTTQLSFAIPLPFPRTSTSFTPTTTTNTTQTTTSESLLVGFRPPGQEDSASATQPISSVSPSVQPENTWIPFTPASTTEEIAPVTPQPAPRPSTLSQGWIPPPPPSTPKETAPVASQPAAEPSTSSQIWVPLLPLNPKPEAPSSDVPSKPRETSVGRKYDDIKSLLSANISIIVQIALASYIHPTTGRDLWKRMIDYDSKKVTVLVANVMNGPDTVLHEDWRSVIVRAAKSGKKVLGYVRTGYLGLSPADPGPFEPFTTRLGSTAIPDWFSQVGRDVDKWYSLYGRDNIAGIFFDETHNECGKNGDNSYAELYRFLSENTKRKYGRAMTVLNPGTRVPKCYEDRRVFVIFCQRNSD
jgi:Spherulation-specific family 4